MRASADFELFQPAERDAAVLQQVIAAQREELEEEIGELEKEAARMAGRLRSWRARCGFRMKRFSERDAPRTVWGETPNAVHLAANRVVIAHDIEVEEGARVVIGEDSFELEG